MSFSGWEKGMKAMKRTVNEEDTDGWTENSKKKGKKKKSPRNDREAKE